VPPRLTGSQPYALAGGEHAGTTGWDRAIRPPGGVPHLARGAGRAEAEGQRQAAPGRATASAVASTARDDTSVAPWDTTASYGARYSVIGHTRSPPSPRFPARRGTLSAQPSSHRPASVTRHERNAQEVQPLRQFLLVLRSYLAGFREDSHAARISFQRC